MTIDKFLQKARKFEVESYKKFRHLSFDHVAFTGTPKKHPYDEGRIILVTDPFSTQTAYYEFELADVEGVEELPNLTTIEGEAVTMVRLWVRKGCVGIRSVPFLVEDMAKRMGPPHREPAHKKR